MALIIQLPADIEQELRREFGDLDQAAKESLLVELYRQEKLSHHHLAQALDLDRFETEALLKRHNVTEDLPTADEILADVQSLEQLRHDGH